VRFQRVCIKDGHPVAWEDLVKGYEYAKGRFVVITKEDFQAAALEKTRTVDIIDFVKSDEIDDRYFETPYYLVPAKGGERAYALLREAIRDADRIGIATFILRDAQHLAAVEVIGDALVLSVMRFADELVDTANFSFPAAGNIRKPELDMAKALVNSLASEWDPDRYSDKYRENLLRIIKGKVKGKEVALEPTTEAPRAEVVDLMERLRRSLEASGTRQRSTGRERRSAAAEKRPAKGTRKAATRKRSRRAA
jgi:DNA end-binding protein Ku